MQKVCNSEDGSLNDALKLARRRPPRRLQSRRRSQKISRLRRL